jgi:hypothetical protein
MIISAVTVRYRTPVILERAAGIVKCVKQEKNNREVYVKGGSIGGIFQKKNERIFFVKRIYFLA